MVGPRPADLRGLGVEHDPASGLRAVEPPRRARPGRGRRRHGRVQLADTTAFIARLATAKEQRGQGLAQALLVDAFAVGREHGALRSELSTDSRTGALGLYEKVGMVVDLDLGQPSHRPDHPGEREAARRADQPTARRSTTPGP